VNAGSTAVVIDTRTLTIIAGIAGVADYGLAITNQVIGTIPVTGALSIAFSPDGTRAYALGYPGAGGFGICAIDTSTLAVTNIIPGKFGGPIGEGLAVTSDGALLYSGGFPPNPFQGWAATPGSVIDTQSLQITGAFPSAGAIVIH